MGCPTSLPSLNIPLAISSSSLSLPTIAMPTLYLYTIYNDHNFTIKNQSTISDGNSNNNNDSSNSNSNSNNHSNTLSRVESQSQLKKNLDLVFESARKSGID